MKRKPTGYVAVCQCGFVVGAMDKDRTASDEASRLLGRWLSSGCTVKPMFDHSWRTQIEQCQCDDAAVQQPAQAAADARDAGLIADLRDIATGKTQHVYAGICPDLMEGHDTRDDECPACKVLLRADTALSTYQQGGK